MPKVSVIIPVYNGEKYLGECLESILGQTLKDIEVICVDDGSTDNSAAILAAYSAKDARIRVINQANTGAGAARNAGLAAATGEYLFFCDTDDWCERGMLKAMYSQAKKLDCDILFAMHYCCEGDDDRTVGRSHYPKCLAGMWQPFAPEDIGRKLFQLFAHVPWNKILRTAFVRLNGLSFQDLPRSNDAFFVEAALAIARSIGVIDKAYYHHRMARPGSVMSSSDRYPLTGFAARDALRDFLKEKDIFRCFGDSWAEAVFLSAITYMPMLADGAAFEAFYAETRRRLLDDPDMGRIGERGFLPAWQTALFEAIRTNESPIPFLLASGRRQKALLLENRRRLWRLLRFSPRRILSSVFGGVARSVSYCRSPSAVTHGPLTGRRHLKIALCGLAVSNLGDRIIFDTARYLVERILDEAGRDDVEIVPVDIGSFKADGGSGRRGPARYLLGKVRKMARVLKKAIGSATYLRWQWHYSPVYGLYAQNERPKLADADMIVFTGGGLVKFHRQNFHFFIDDITAFADEHGIPVIFNAVGVEGYDAHDGECRLLRNALRRRCVKSITTRDDLELLTRDYGVRAEAKARVVCDPAFWVSEKYGIARNPGARVVGLNVIRPEIFAEYSSGVSKDEMFRLYAGVVERLLHQGREVQIFSNGVESDTSFAKEFISAHPAFAADPRFSAAYPKTASELVGTIAGYERFVAVRLHAAIVGTVLGVPNVSIVWNRKQPLFGTQIGMPENFIGRDGFSADNVVGRLLEAQPYRMDEAYKNSVLESLREAIGHFLPARGERRDE